MKNPAPYRYDIVGSFLRTAAIHEAREKFEAGAITAEELAKVEDTEIRGLVKKEKNVGLKAVTDGEYRRSFWHMDFLWGLTGTQKVKTEHFSVAFKGFQPKAETVRIVDKLEKKEDITARIHEAEKYVPLEQLSLSPQCGFASTEEGNLLTDEDQWKKLALVREIAQEVWG